MNIYNLKRNTLSSIQHEEFKLEKDLQAIVEANLDTLFNLTLVSSEFSIDRFRLDTLAFDEESQAFVIIEYKKGHNYSVIDQGYSYLSSMLNHKADFILEYNEKQHQTLKRGEIKWAASRVMFLSPSFNRYQKNSVNFKDIPFELWEVRRFAGDLIVIDQVQSSSSKESIKNSTATKNDTVISQVSAEVEVYSEEDHVAKLAPDMLEVWEELREKLDDWPDTRFCARKSYVGVRRGNKGVCSIYFQKYTIKVDIYRGEKTEEGQKGINFFDLDDYKQIVVEKNWPSNIGRTSHKYEILLNRRDEIRYVLDLIEQKYKSV